MKHLLSILALLVLSATANATIYYVSAAGNDANNGTSTATPWRTLSKVNTATYAANDTVLLRRGDVFFGCITVNRNNMTFGAYGTGARPLISGFVNINTWTALGNGVFQSEVVNARNWLNMVVRNGLPQQIGRFPNADAPNGGYLTFEAATSTSITDNELSTTVNWTGAEVAIRKNGWVIDRCIITSHAGNTINYRMARNVNSGVAPVLSPAKLNHGYFFMDDPRTLDQLGEWYFDTTAKRLQMFFGTSVPAGTVVRVSTFDTLLNMNNKSYVNVSDINFEGANMGAVFSQNGGFIKLQNSDINWCGAKGVQVFNTNDVLIENVNVNYALANSIQVIDRLKPNVIIRNCYARNTGLLAGMGSFYDDSDYKGIYATASTNLLMELNRVDSTGLSGIQFGGNDVIVQKNTVDHYCMRVHDNGGIYTYTGGNDANPGGFFTNRIVRNNMIMNGVGNTQGTPSTVTALAGIYLDGRTMNVQVIDNSIFNNGKHGIHCNNPSNITIRGNTFFNNLNDISFMRWAGSSISNLNIKRNISFPLLETQRNIYYTNATLNSSSPTGLADNLRTLGQIDSNYYQTYTDASIMFELYDTLTGAPLTSSPQSLEGWKQLSGFDQQARRPAPRIAPYTITRTVSSNLFTNSQFTSNITGMTVFGSNVTATWDNTSKLTGTGSLRMNFLAPVANRYGLLHSPVGPISNTKQYVLRFRIMGGSANGIVRAYIRKSASPFNNLVPTQTKSFGTAASTQEFLFDAPTADAAGGSLVIEVEQFSGTTYIDDVEFVEVNATVNSVQSQVRFEYNPTNAPKTIALDAKYIGVDSTVYNGTITLAPFTSRVLVKGGTIDTVPSVNAGLDRTVILPQDSTFVTGVAVGGTITSYRWTKISGPLQFTILNPTSATTRITSLVAGVYRFELKATTNKGMIGSDTLAIIVTTGILPVELLDFKAVKGSGTVHAQWAVTGEKNSSHYTVQRSTDGNRFRDIARVNALNQETVEARYGYTDLTPVTGKNYYRLAMVAADGSISYSKTVMVQFNGGKQVLEVNRAIISDNAIQLTVSSDQTQSGNLLLLDAAGRTLLNKPIAMQAGSNQLLYNLGNVSKGLYYLRLSSGSEQIVKSLLAN